MDIISAEQSHHGVEQPVFTLTDEKLNRYKQAAGYEDVSDEDAEKFLRLIWEISCAVAAIQCGIDPVQCALGISSVNSGNQDGSTVQ
ncbi:MAG: hypothetical protein MK137_05875 [Rickettsiales bacterium]|nr:hypothetical protein [Rickettsiales bacterium]